MIEKNETKNFNNHKSNNHKFYFNNFYLKKTLKFNNFHI